MFFCPMGFQFNRIHDIIFNGLDNIFADVGSIHTLGSHTLEFSGSDPMKCDRKGYVYSTYEVHLKRIKQS